MQDEATKTLTKPFPLPLPPVPFGKDMWQALAEDETPLLVYGMGNGADKLISRFEKYNINIISCDFFFYKKKDTATENIYKSLIFYA